MSLLTSIFGGNTQDSSSASSKNNKDNRESTLFDNPTIPSPQLYTYPTRRKVARERKGKSKNDQTESERTVQKKRKNVADASSDADDADHDKDLPAKEGDNNDNNNSVDERTIFVGNLPLDTTRKTLTKIFRDCGAIESTRIRSVPVVGVKLPQSNAGNQDLVKKVCANTDRVDKGSHKSTVQGYVVFRSADSVPRALQLNNTIIADEGDTSTATSRRIRVDHARTNYDARRSVFVGNLPYNADESTLQEHFAKQCQFEITDIEGVRIVRDKESYAAKGFGYVLFRDRAMVATALQRVPETVYMDRPLRVTVCGRRFKGKSGREDDSGSGPSPHKKAKMNDSSSLGALKRILAKEQKHRQQQGGSQKKRRARATKKSGDNKTTRKQGVSKRAAAEAKVDKRVKKIQRRVKKGMGRVRR